jgi:hypothetical protein
VYGVRIISDTPYDLPAADAPERTDHSATIAVVSACEDDFAGVTMTKGDAFACRELPDGRIHLCWRGWYEFIVAADGSRVAHKPLDGCDRTVFENFLFTQVLGVALVRQRHEPLHAAVVEIGDGAIGFLGDCTYGKSTLVASFLERGHRLITDDMLIVERRRGEPHAVPGTGRIKLLPDSAARFLPHAGCGLPLNPLTAKRAFVLDQGSRRPSSLPLRLLYLLPEPGDRDTAGSIEIVPVSRAEMVRELVKNTFTIHLVDRERIARQFDAAAQLASSVDAYRLRYPSGLNHLPALRDRIVEHAITRTALVVA